ncbi:MAG: secondary thiamine-phosphate synthase enzyme YjbQ [Gammaproteobacteria bacterium]|nr:secondary thiamine-phosphate synthase enzyme YjbQ [Gammaproteobacteria bacterium]
MVGQIKVRTDGQGLYELTPELVEKVSASGIAEGLCTVFITHTSASLVVQENADPSAKFDLEAWLNRLVPEGDVLYTHILEGPDDMPAHIKSALTSTSLSIPIMNHALTLGTWQGIYLWEHRQSGNTRTVAFHIGD